MAAFYGSCWQRAKTTPWTTALTLAYSFRREGRAANTLVAYVRARLLRNIRKLHLYDAFNIQESRLVDAGRQIPPLIEVDGMRVGLMTCYDLRFPELALS